MHKSIGGFSDMFVASPIFPKAYSQSVFGNSHMHTDVFVHTQMYTTNVFSLSLTHTHTHTHTHTQLVYTMSSVTVQYNKSLRAYKTCFGHTMHSVMSYKSRMAFMQVCTYAWGCTYVHISCPQVMPIYTFWGVYSETRENGGEWE